MNIICPKCGYQRTQNDDTIIPLTICPSCQIVYAKFRQNQNVNPRQQTRSGTTNNNYFNIHDITIIQAILISVFLIVIVTLTLPTLEKIGIHIIAPFDTRPQISISEMISHPDQIETHKNKLCAWANREYLRNPSFSTKAIKEGACKK